MGLPGRKWRKNSARFASPRTPFCYTEYNRFCASGENGTFMYKVPEMFVLRQDGQHLHMDWNMTVDLLRLITQSAGV